jgi:DNA-directed RNA polymerase subunit H (RpoH/RPB5)
LFHNYPHVPLKLGVALADKDAPSHDLIPPHKLVAKEEAEKILAQYRVSRLQIPKIRAKDAGLAGTGAKPGQVVEIARLDGSTYYRLVVE